MSVNGALSIDIARDFSRYPGGRYKRHGKNSGEAFRDELLVPRLTEAIREDRQLCVKIDGVRGYGSSFLEEAFGGLVRKAIFQPDEIRSHLKIQVEDVRFSIYADLIDRYISEASLAAAG